MSPTMRRDAAVHPRDASNRIHAQSREAGNFTFIERISSVKHVTNGDLLLLKNYSLTNDARIRDEARCIFLHR